MSVGRQHNHPSIFLWAVSITIRPYVCGPSASFSVHLSVFCMYDHPPPVCCQQNYPSIRLPYCLHNHEPYHIRLSRACLFNQQPVFVSACLPTESPIRLAGCSSIGIAIHPSTHQTTWQSSCLCDFSMW